MYRKHTRFILFLFLISLFAGCSTSSVVNQKPYTDFTVSSTPDAIKAGPFDTGKMWTFDFPPAQYFNKEYSFNPGNEWFDKVRLSALRFATYCSASFISEDGLIMTNNHCARESAVDVSREGENLQKNGFFAETMTDERPVPGLFVDQLVLIKDVTDEVLTAINKGVTEEEKISNEEKIITEIEKREEKETGLVVSVTPLYNGGKYSLYGYKRYNDVRLVFTPEHLLGHFGGEYDNFTYPRYNMDCAFFRVYNEGKPLKTNNFYKWSHNGAEPGEPVFVVGNPGSTSRLLTVSQLEYLRDYVYPRTLKMYTSLVNLYQNMIAENPDSSEEYNVQLLKYLNAQKVFDGIIKGLNDPVLMQRKKDFENTFRSKVQNNEKLNKEYGTLWDDIKKVQDDSRVLNDKVEALDVDPDNSAIYFFVARDVVDLADQLKEPESERSEDFQASEIDSTIDSIIPEDYEPELNNKLLEQQIKNLIKYFGEDNSFVKTVTGGKSPAEAVKYMLDNSVVDNPVQLRELIKKGPDAILNSSDLFIYYLINSLPLIEDMEQKSALLDKKDELLSGTLGKALFDVYNTSIPPDATFTLRISDGIVDGYPYNGTIAPPVTTFYGMYDRYYSFYKKDPWDLPEKWKNPPADFNLATPFNFISTNDITGGNSGSPVINKNAEIVGVAFDGNIESLPGGFIFRTEQNRTVSVHSQGIIEALSHVYKTGRLVDEILSGKIIKDQSTSNK
jgi:hypothetical protein